MARLHHAALALALTGAAALVPTGGCLPAKRLRAHLPPPTPPTPFDPATLHGEARAADPGDPLPLGHHADSEGGAYVLRDGNSVAIVSGRHGHLVAFGAPGGVDGIDRIRWGAMAPLSPAPSELVSIEVLDGRALHVVERLQTHDGYLHAWLALEGRVLTIHTQLVAGRERLPLTLGEVWAWSNTPTWIEGEGFVRAGGSTFGRFLGRRSAGIAYAACRGDGRPFDARVASPGLPGYHRRAYTGEDRHELKPGEASPVRRLELAWSSHSLGDAASALPCSRDLPRLPLALGPTAARHVEVARCESPKAFRARRQRAPDGDPTRRPSGPFLRFHATARELVVPADCARARLTAPGHAPGPWIDPLQGWPDHREPVAGLLRWRIRDEAGRPLPAKLELEGRSPTPAPDWGEDTEGGAAKNYVYSRGDGERPVPPGQYVARVQRGFELEAVQQEITIAAGQTTTVDATLRRAVDTTGWLSADLHVHALPSFDAPTLLEDRVLSLAGVGVEVAVSTDHNAVTDYAPAIAKLQLGAHLASIVGDEITTEEPEVGHFNAFPLDHPQPPLPWRARTVAELFADARAATPDGVLQVNHPRMGTIGYFDILHLDRDDVTGWAERLPRAATAFDAIEVFSGDHYTRIGAVQAVMLDWFALLDAGLRYTATGNSDSHKIAYQDAGMPRNWVASATDDPAQLDEASFVRAVREGRVIVSSGPFLTLTVGDASLGDGVTPGRHRVRVTADAPGWIDLDRVDLVVRGELVHRFAVDADRSAHPRLSTEVELDLAANDWVIAIAAGDDSMPGYYRARAKPYAFTNPIFVR